MRQRSRFRWKVFLVLIFCGPLVSLYSPGQAEEFPEPDPPKIDLGMPEEVRAPSGLTEGVPSAEWAFHKTADDAHPDGNEQQFIWLMNRARANPTQEGVWLATDGAADATIARTTTRIVSLATSAFMFPLRITVGAYSLAHVLCVGLHSTAASMPE